MNLFNRNPKQLANEETLDIEESIRRLIQRLLEDSLKQGKSTTEISTNLTSMVRALSNPATRDQVLPPPPPPAQYPGLRLQLSGKNLPAAGALRVEYLHRTVIPYLGALGEMQVVLDEIQRREHRPLLVYAITTEPQLTIWLDHAEDALNTISANLPAWREQYAQANSPGQRITTPRGIETLTPRQQIQSIKTKLSMEIIENFAPSLSTTDKVTFSIRLQPMVETLLASDLHIAHITPPA